MQRQQVSGFHFSVVSRQYVFALLAFFEWRAERTILVPSYKEWNEEIENSIELNINLGKWVQAKSHEWVVLKIENGEKDFFRNNKEVSTRFFTNNGDWLYWL